MALDFPWEMYMQAQQARNQNRQQMNQDIAGLGQGLGNTMADFGQMAQHQKMKQVLSQLMGQAQGGQPIGPMQPGAAPMAPIPPDPVLKTLIPFLQADQSLIPGALPAIVKGEFLKSRTPKSAQQMIPVAFGPGGLRANPPGGSLKKGEVGGEIPYKDYVARMMTQGQHEDAQRKFETVVTQKTQSTMGPINDAVSTTDQLIKAYQEATSGKEVGPAVGRFGTVAAGVTGGKKFPKLFNYNRAKQALISTLFKGIGVNRFTMGEVQNLINNLPSGGEDPQRGMQVLQEFKNNLLLRRQQAQQDLESQLMIYRGIMIPGGMGGGSMSSPEINVNVGGESDSLSQYEE